MARDLAPLYQRLEGLLRPYAPHFESEYWPPGLWRQWPGRRVLFASVEMKRTHVSVYLYATVLFPDLLAHASPDLLSRQTKAGRFFNYRKLQPTQETELRELLRCAFQRFDAELPVHPQ
jgi:hypothetical protein